MMVKEKKVLSVDEAKSEFYAGVSACVNEHAGVLSYAELISILAVKQSELSADLSFSLLQNQIAEVQK